jgi:hypothetical protein
MKTSSYGRIAVTTSPYCAKSNKAANRLSVQRVKSTFGNHGDRVPGLAQSDFLLLLDFAENGITPIIGYDFVPEATNIPPLRARYEKAVHTVNSLLFDKFKNGTMLIMKTVQAQTIPGVHFSPRQYPEGHVIGDLSGNVYPSQRYSKQQGRFVNTHFSHLG